MVAGAAETKGQEAQGLEEVLGGTTADLLPLGLGARLHHQHKCPHQKGSLAPQPSPPGNHVALNGQGPSPFALCPPQLAQQRHVCMVGG